MAEESKFPAGFFWGAATSAYQIEGGIENNDWARPTLAWPNLSGQALAKAESLPSAGRACDHYNRYEEDFDIAKSLGQNAHRFSIEWSRIEPEEGKFDEAELGHYRKVLGALRERGIEPFVTLWHFTLPLWLARMGGFENKKAPFYFSRYCEHVVKNLGQGIGAPRFWLTINEPTVYATLGFLSGAWPPFKKNPLVFLRALGGMAMSHNLAYQKIKAVNPEFQVGIAANNTDFSSNANPLNLLRKKFLVWFLNHRFLTKIRERQDFIGLNYYFHQEFGRKIDCEKSDRDWSAVMKGLCDIYPKGIYNVLMELGRYRKPVYITENGIADAKDAKRAKFIKDHLYWVKRAIDDKVDVRGYFYWSLLDNFEWELGFGPRYGLVEVDFETMERRIRPSAYEYKKICETNSLNLKP